MNLWSLGLREIIRSKNKLGLILLILTVGAIGPFFTSSVKTSVAHYLDVKARSILSADLALNSNGVIDDQTVVEAKTQYQATATTFETEFVTMAKGNDAASLVAVRGVDANFPLNGEFVLRSGSHAKAEVLSATPLAWVYPEVLTQLRLKVGETIAIGKVEFKIDGVLDDAPGVTSAISAFAPRIYVGRKYVEQTGLVMFGSQVSYRMYLQVPSSLDVRSIEPEFTNQDIAVKTPEDAVRGFERFFHFFDLYLVAITMIVFVLSWVSAFYILQIYLNERLRNAAIYLVNGGARWKAASLYVLQTALLTLASLAVAASVSALSFFIVNSQFASSLPSGLVLQISWSDWLFVSGLILLSALAFNVPFINRLYLSRLQVLLGESSSGVERLSVWMAAVSYIPLVAIFMTLAVWLLDSPKDAAYIAGGMLVAALIGWALSRLFFKSAYRLFKTTPGNLRLVMTSVSRARYGANLCFLAFMLVALTLNLVPHLLKTVVREISPLTGSEVPSLFLLNIPESSVDELKSFADKNKISLRYLSPLILARLEKIAGKDATLERFQKFPVRLSYRRERLASEKIVAGADFPGDFKGAVGNNAGSGPIAEASVEKNFADRSGIHLGDELLFDVQSVPIQVKVTSFRSVKWTSFNPNFFIMIQPGVLDDAPKSYIANVNIEGDASMKSDIQYKLSSQFPDLSVIDIGRTLDQVLGIARSIIGPITVTAWIVVSMSLMILIGIIFHNLRLRRNEMDVQKIMGADAALIRRLIVSEYAMVGFIAWFLGAGCAVALASVVTFVIFDLPLGLSHEAVVVSLVTCVGGAVAISWFTSSAILNERGVQNRV